MPSVLPLLPLFKSLISKGLLGFENSCAQLTSIETITDLETFLQLIRTLNLHS